MRPLWQRVVALTAAYAIALASLIATFGAARAAADLATTPGAVICHTVVAGDQAPVPASGQSNHCADNCCIGCLTLLAALPPTPKIAGVPLPISQPVRPPQIIVLSAGLQTKHHRSRAPPQTA